MKKQILVGFLMLCLLFPAYGKGNRGRSASSTKRTSANIQRAAQSSAPGKPSTDMTWSPYYVDLTKSENKNHLTNMTNFPSNFSQEDRRIVVDGSVKEKVELARTKLASGTLPGEWFQLGYILGLYQYFTDKPARAKEMGKDRLRFIRFMEMYVLDLYLNRHEEIRNQANFSKIRDYQNALHEFTFADNPNVERVTVATTNANGYTTFYAGDAQQEGNGTTKEVELVENNNSKKNGQGDGSQGGGHSGGSDGDPNGSPYGVPGGTKTIDPFGVEYDGRHVYYEFIKNTEDVSVTFAA